MNPPSRPSSPVPRRSKRRLFFGEGGYVLAQSTTVSRDRTNGRYCPAERTKHGISAVSVLAEIDVFALSENLLVAMTKSIVRTYVTKSKIGVLHNIVMLIFIRARYDPRQMTAASASFAFVASFFLVMTLVRDRCVTRTKNRVPKSTLRTCPAS